MAAIPGHPDGYGGRVGLVTRRSLGGAWVVAVSGGGDSVACSGGCTASRPSMACGSRWPTSTTGPGAKPRRPTPGSWPNWPGPWGCPSTWDTGGHREPGHFEADARRARYRLAGRGRPPSGGVGRRRRPHARRPGRDDPPAHPARDRARGPRRHARPPPAGRRASPWSARSWGRPAPSCGPTSTRSASRSATTRPTSTPPAPAPASATTSCRSSPTSTTRASPRPSSASAAWPGPLDGGRRRPCAPWREAATLADGPDGIILDRETLKRLDPDLRRRGPAPGLATAGLARGRHGRRSLASPGPPQRPRRGPDVGWRRDRRLD